MNNDSALISTSILTAIWDETHKDNIELITPFIKYIIYKNYKINEQTDREQIIEELKNEFSFNNFPHAILEVILKRMTRKHILMRDNNEFILKKDLKDDYNLFSNRLGQAKQNMSTVIDSIYNHLKDEIQGITKEETKNALSNFIDSYGYNTYNNILSIKAINPKSDYINYCIGEYIYKISKDNVELFNEILKIFEGYMIANVIYMQIENDNNSTLKNLNCYLDAPFILRVLGYKTKEENVSAQELFNLLKKYKANICCFEHNYQEVINIMTFYKKHIGTFQESTLEYFDLKEYTETQVDMAISNLENRFKELGIKIVSTPDYTKDKYKDVIDVAGLEEKLKEYYNNKEISYDKGKAITNDVNSVCAINMLRKGRKFSKLENCTHIFVTTFYYLKYASKQVMKEIDDLEIGLVIDDLDLTTFLWFKDFSKNNELPKLRLIENALAATDPNPKILEKANKYLEDIKRDKLISDIDGVSQLLSKNYLKYCSDYIKMVENNPDNVTKENFGNYIKSKDDELRKTKNELIDTKERSIKKDIKIESMKKNIIDNADMEINKKVNKFNNISNVIYYTLMVGIIISCLIISIISFINDNINFYSVFSLIFSLIGVLDTLIPKAKFSHRLVEFICKKYKIKITKEENEKANKLIGEI
ncbi:MAG: hypothetical protein ACI4XM_05955 [Candidatus Coprovivens sp.]